MSSASGRPERARSSSALGSSRVGHRGRRRKDPASPSGSERRRSAAGSAAPGMTRPRLTRSTEGTGRRDPAGAQTPRQWGWPRRRYGRRDGRRRRAGRRHVGVRACVAAHVSPVGGCFFPPEGSGGNHPVRDLPRERRADQRARLLLLPRSDSTTSARPAVSVAARGSSEAGVLKFSPTERSRQRVSGTRPLENVRRGGLALFYGSPRTAHRSTEEDDVCTKEMTLPSSSNI